MADFNKAFAFTSKWEGPWDGGNKPLPKDQAYLDDNSAAYGLTPWFMYEQGNWQTVNLAAMQSIDATKAAEIWRTTRWQWFNLEYLMSDEIAILLFDWAVRRPDPCAKAMAAVSNKPLVNVKFRTLRKYPITRKYDYHAKKIVNPTNDGQNMPTCDVIDAINALCLNSAGVFDKNLAGNVYTDLINQRIKVESNIKEGVKRRLACLLEGEYVLGPDSFRSMSAARQKEILNKVDNIQSGNLKPKKRLAQQGGGGGGNSATADADTEGGIGVGGWLALLALGYMVFSDD